MSMALNRVRNCAIMFGIAVAWSCAAAEPKTWYVDDDYYGQSGLNGSQAKPYGTIQDAVNAAKSGDTIKVAPGLYNQGYTDQTKDSITFHNRVVIDSKSLTIEATSANRGDTIIEGASDPSSANGLGANAVRCVYFTTGKAATNTVFRGFTFRGGRSFNGGDNAASSGGGIVGVWSNTYDLNFPTAIDCDFVDCAATRGGAIRCVNAIRCRFLRCFSTNNSAVGRNGSFFNCIFAHNYSKPAGTAHVHVIEYFTLCVNCTFIDNSARVANLIGGSTVGVYNSYASFIGDDGCAFNVTSANKQSTPFIFNCVIPSYSKYDTSAKLSCNCLYMDDSFQLASPATEDCHPLASAATSMATGDADAYRRLFPAHLAAEADKDFDGKPRFGDDGTLMVGALQTAVTPASGLLRLSSSKNGVNASSVVANGITNIVLSTEETRASYLTTPTWPSTAVVEYILPSGTDESKNDLFSIRYYRMDNNDYVHNFPRIGEKCVVAMLPPSGVEAKLNPYYGASRYVDQTNGTDTTDDDQGMSAAKPWKTLQFAADNATSYTVIHAAAGDYDEGGYKPANDVMSRLYINKAIRFVGDDGAETTRIVGAADPEAEEDNAGCGLNAVRCVRIEAKKYGCVQGFSLYDGHTDRNNKENPGLGGGFFLSSYKGKTGYLVDSIVTNCAGSRGVIYGGIVARCKIADNNIESQGNGVTRGATLVSCIVAGNTSVARAATTADIGQDVTAVNCTVDTSLNAYSINTDVDLINTIMDGGKLHGSKAPRTCVGTLFSPDTQKVKDLADRYAEPYFVNKADGDYRVYSYSRAVTAGTTDYTVSNAWLCVMGDYEGKTFASLPMVGAYQTAVAAPNRVLVVETRGDVGDGAIVQPSGVLTFPEEPLTISTENATRPCIGFEVNGVFTPGVTSVTIDPTKYGETESCIVRAVFSANWYVDAVNGSDANNGWTAGSAMKTLAAVMVKTSQGDTVHALPGVYSEGTMMHDNPTLTKATKEWGEPMTYSRVVVQTNVTLVAEGSVEETVIEGAMGTERTERGAKAYSTKYLLGTNAVRCVFLNDGAKVRGFTIRNGRVNASGEQDDNGWGAGVCARNNTSSEVVDCVISNCASSRGAAGIYTTFRRCRIVENSTPGNSPAGRYCAYYGCYIAGNQDDGGQYGGVVANIRDFVGNTIAADNVNSSGKLNARSIASQDIPTKSKFWNNVILQPYSETDAAKWPQATLKNAYYNFFADGTQITESNISGGDNNDFGKTLDELKIGDDGVPAVGSPVVDAGGFDYWQTNDVLSADLNGVPRGRNGNRVDVGAFEQPWLARYAQDMGGRRRFEVTDVDLAVFENGESKVEIPSGTVSLKWQPCVSANANARINLRVTGNGTLKVFRDGELDATFSSGSTEQTYVFAAKVGETYELDFTYEPGENDEGSAILLSAKIDLGLMMLVQ